MRATPQAPASLPGVWPLCLLFLLLLSAAGVVAFMVIPSGPSPKTPKSKRGDRVRRRSNLAEDVAAAESSFNPGEMTSLQLRPYEKALAQMQASGTAASDTGAISAIETELKLPPHTLLIFVNWKKKQSEALPPEKTDTERKAAKKAKVEAEMEATQKARQAQLDQEKQLAAAAIKREYDHDLDNMMLKAARACLADLGEGDLDIRSSVIRVLARTDRHGNKLFFTIGRRTLFKHAQKLSLNANYRPNTKGGAPSVVNSEEGGAFIFYLRAEYAKYNRTAQNSKQLADLNKFIVDRYKLMFFANQDATPPEISNRTLRRLRQLMKVKPGAAKFVSVRRWEAMGDPRYRTAICMRARCACIDIAHRNYISWYCTSNVAMKDVPVELRFNWDDTSLFVAGEQRGAGEPSRRCMLPELY